jgi:hypothetical protein
MQERAAVARWRRMLGKDRRVKRLGIKAGVEDGEEANH